MPAAITPANPTPAAHPATPPVRPAAPRRPHRRRPAAVVVVALLAVALLSLPGAPVAADQPPVDAAPFLVGAAEASTDPLGTICIGGYGSFCTRPSKGVRDPLTARGLAVSSAADPAQSVIVVTATAVGLFAAYKDTLGPTGIDAARVRIGARTGLDPRQVVIVSDHSHAGPDTIGIWGGVDEAYMSILTDGIVDAGVRAFQERRPATLDWAVVDAAAEGYLLDSSYDGGPTDDAAMDNEFRVLFADDADGEPIATFVNYAPHATVCGQCDDELSGDWTAWVADEVAARWGGVGFGAVGTLGAADWNKSGRTPDEREAEARTRIVDLLEVAHAQRTPVVGDEVMGRSVFIREAIAQPVLLLNYFPGLGDPAFGQTDGEIRIDRSIRPPYATAGTVGTWGGAVRIGDLLWSTFPGEPFPQLGDLLRGSVEGVSAHFLLGGAQDFLGYMTADQESYEQTVEEGALFLAGCPEEELYEQAGVAHDGACPDHWTLMVSPTIGIHLVCTAQDVAEDVGLVVVERDERCAALTATDGVGDPLDPSTPRPPVTAVTAATIAATTDLGNAR